MARLIDADALLEVLTLWHENIDTINSPTDVIVHNVLSSVMDDINDCETIDAEPVRHGRWVKCQGKSHIWYCSECGEKINYKQNRRTYNIPEVPVWQKNKRCRNCGAKMDGGLPNNVGREDGGKEG